MANETLITDLVAQEAMQQLEELDRAMEGTLQQFQNCARELAQGLKVPVEVTGDVDALRTLTNTVMRDAQQATQQLTQQLQQQQQVVANTTNTISRQLQAQENLNKAQREAFTQDQQAQDLAKALLGTRQQNYELLARYTAEMKANKDAQKQVNEQEKQGLITAEQAIQKRATLMAAYDKTKFAAQELTKILAAENKEANAVEGSYAQLSQKLERLKMAYKQMNDAQKASAGGKQLESEIQNLDARLKDLAADMGEHQRNVGNYAIAAQSMKSSLRELTEEIAQLTMQYNEMSDSEKRSDIGMQLRDKITQLTEEAGKYKDVISDVKQSISGSASDTRWFDTMIESGKLMVSTFGLCSSAAKALGISNDTLQQSMMKVQAAMQAVQALTVIQNTLQKQSNVMKGIAVLQSRALAAATALEAKATTQATGATVAQTIAMKAFNAVANANPYVLLATAILTVIGLIVSYTSATEDATEADKASAAANLNSAKAEKERAETLKTLSNEAEYRAKTEREMANEIASSVADQVANYRMLQTKWQECGNDIQLQKKFLQEYKSQLDNTGLGIHDLNSAHIAFERLAPRIERWFYKLAEAAAAYSVYKKALEVQYENDINGTRANGRYYTNYKAGGTVHEKDIKRLGLTKDDYETHFSGYTLTASGAAKMTEDSKKTAQELLAIDQKRVDAAKKLVDQKNKEVQIEQKGLQDAGLNPGGRGHSGGGGGGGNGRNRGHSGGGRGHSGGRGGSTTTDNSKSLTDLQNADNQYVLESMTKQNELLEEFTDKWLKDKKEAIDKEAEVDKAANKKRYDALLAELDKSKKAKKLTDEQYLTEKALIDEAYTDIEKSIDEDALKEKKELEDKWQKHKEEQMHKELEELQKKHEQEISEINAQGELRLDAEQKRYLGELNAAKGNAEEIEKIQKEHADRVAAIGEENAVAIAQVTVRTLEEELKKEQLTDEDREELSNRLATAKKALNDAILDHTEGTLDREVEAEKDAMEKRKEAREKMFEKWQDGIQKVGEAMNNIGEFADAMFDNQIAKVEELIDAEQERYDKEVNHIEWLAERGAITTEESEIRKRDAEEAHAKRQEALEKKKAAWEYKKAIAQKANQVAQIGISTALGIMQALAMFPPNIPLSVFVGAMGAIQLATALAQPIKAYAEGTKGHPHPGGLAVVGDANRAELVMYGKRAWITPDSPTLVDLPKGAEVMPDASKVDLVQMGSSLFMTLPKRKGGGGPIIVNDYEALEGRVANNTKVLAQGLSRFEHSVKREMRRQNFRNYINART